MDLVLFHADAGSAKPTKCEMNDDLLIVMAMLTNSKWVLEIQVTCLWITLHDTFFESILELKNATVLLYVFHSGYKNTRSV